LHLVILGAAGDDHVADAQHGLQRLLHLDRRGQHRDGVGGRTAVAELQRVAARGGVDAQRLLLVGVGGCVDGEAALEGLADLEQAAVPAEQAIGCGGDLLAEQRGELVDVLEAGRLGGRHGDGEHRRPIVGRALDVQVEGRIAGQHRGHRCAAGEAGQQGDGELLVEHLPHRRAEIQRRAELDVGEGQQRVEAAGVTQQLR
jgi:hypothetical protein